MNLYFKFYIHGLVFFLICLLYSILFSVQTLNVYDIIMFIILLSTLPLIIGHTNNYLTEKLYKLKRKHNKINIYIDGLTLLLILLPVGYFISLTEYTNSTLLILTVNLLSPLIFGFISYKYNKLIVTELMQ